MCRPWVKQPGPYDDKPKRPEPGQTLKYFNTQEGLEALSHDPLLRSGKQVTRADLPAPKAVQPASAGGSLPLCRTMAGWREQGEGGVHTTVHM